ncbi:maleylacetoacetate isomerase [Kordiimonas pumila]|uniref:Maleylacetoacetate isomerase n=1 Tax=Kordiimonas pumila TaxID=2161677 RepID=A0ABV7D7P8_9PROT|nr:maleylacetoacetate isomerase [Kordiimonas pumila]
MIENKLKLYGYWRSGTSYRTRIALNLKGVAYETHPVDLRQGQHKQSAFLQLNPQGLVPALDTGTAILAQSPAIIEWLEEAYPEPALLPKNLQDRAYVRAMAAVVGCDVHPINNLRILQHIKTELGGDEAAISNWTAKWISAGFDTLETMIEKAGGKFAFGDAPTVADCYIMPQIYSAERFNVDLQPYPRLMAVASHALQHPAFTKAHPSVQPDAD